MGKKTDKKKGLFLWIISGAAVFILLLEGFLYFNAEAYPHPLFRWMFIIQNGVKAFTFRSDIGLKDMAKVLENSSNLFETLVGYAYTFVIFIAPLCTAAAVYTAIKRVFRIRSVKWLFINERNIIVFGYNDEVKALLSSRESKQRIHIVATNISQNEETELLKSGIAVYKVECLKLQGRQLNSLFSRMKLKNTKEIILFDESSAKNFSVYQMFHREQFKNMLHPEVKFFCRCEDEGIKRIIEDYHDEKRLEAKDLEIVSIPELRVKKMLQEHPLHAYYSGAYKEKNEWNTEEYKKWNLHLLIVGFGKLGQQLLLQAMNLGVISSDNDILIDVVDFDIKNKKSIFANHFDENYVEMGEDEFVIPSEKADGSFKIRFHNMDIRHKQFTKLLNETGAPEQDGLYNYIAICIKDMDIGLSCMSQVEYYLNRYKDAADERKVSVGIRMEANRQMADYVRRNNGTFQNVFVIDDTEKVLTLKDLIDDELAKAAKTFNYIYRTLDIISEKDYAPKPEDITADQETLETEYWHNKEMYKRNSNRAIAQHAEVRHVLLVKNILDKLDACFGANGTILKDKGKVWTFNGTENDLIDLLNDENTYPWVTEFAKLEHRRWCYFMASCGWKALDSFYWEKDEKQKANACMCNWKELSQKGEPKNGIFPKSYACKYDLMPLLKEYLDTKE